MSEQWTRTPSSRFFTSWRAQTLKYKEQQVLRLATSQSMVSIGIHNIGREIAIDNDGSTQQGPDCPAWRAEPPDTADELEQC